MKATAKDQNGGRRKRPYRNWRVDVTYRGGRKGSQIVGEVLARDAFEACKNDGIDLVVLLKWDDEWRDSEDASGLRGGWVIVDQWMHSHLAMERA